MSTPVAQGGNVKKVVPSNPGSTKQLRVSFLLAHGAAARMFKTCLDAAAELGVTHTGFLKYRRFPAKMMMLNLILSGKNQDVDSFKDACEFILKEYPHLVDVK